MAAKQTFEEAMSKLERIVHELDTSEPTLDEAVKKFEEGVKLSKFCSKKLDETERKITVLLKNHDGSLSETPFLKENEKQDQ